MSNNNSVHERLETQEDQKNNPLLIKESKEQTPISHQPRESKELLSAAPLSNDKLPFFMASDEKRCISLKNPLTRDTLFELNFDKGVEGLLEYDDERMITQKDNSPTKVWKFGRNKKKSDLLLPQLTRLSNLHFEIILERNCQFYIRDLSCNGTWVNGIKLPPNMKFKLFDSDVIGLGYGIEEDCINYELEFNNTFMAQHRYLFLKKIKLASQTNPEIRLKKQSEAIKSQQQKRKFDEIESQEPILEENKNENDKSEEHVSKKIKTSNRSVIKSDEMPFISDKLQLNKNDNNNNNKGLQRSGNPNVIQENSISTRFVNVQQQYRFFPDQLGQGAFATVKKAERLSDKKLFAIKIISKLKLVGTALGGVQSEMEVLTSINHPRIVKLHDFFEDAENFYIVMDLVEGGDLMDFVAENGSIEEDACCEIAFQILQAVKYMHERNITHRDLKPDNILIEQDSPVLIKITDFGLAKKGNAFKTFCGTLAYIAPELLQDIANRNQLRPRYMRPEYTTQVDMWSLGCLVYVIMTGHLPFSASSEEDLFKQIKIGEFHQGPLKMNNISEKGQSFLKALICVDPSKRLNAQEALKHSWFLEGRGSLTEPSQIVACSQKIALSQKANNLQDVNNKNVNRSEIENWKKDPMMDGSSQPWKRQKDPMNPPAIPKGFVPLNENETLDSRNRNKVGDLVFYHRAKTSNSVGNISNVSGSSADLGKRNISNTNPIIIANFFDKNKILADLDVTKPVAYYEEDREALIKLYPLENARNTTATKKLLGIDKKIFTIGRNRLADYTISDNTISKLHCMFAKLPDAKNPSTFNWWLYCYSTNPMFVNDIKLTKHMKMKVYIGDAIKFVWNTARNTYSGYYISYMDPCIEGDELNDGGMLDGWKEWRQAISSTANYRGTAQDSKKLVIENSNEEMDDHNCEAYSEFGNLNGYRHVDTDKGNIQAAFPTRDKPEKMTEEERQFHKEFLNRLVE